MDISVRSVDNNNYAVDVKTIGPDEIGQFQKKLVCLKTFRKTPEQIADKLFEIVPENLELNALVDLIFQQGRRSILSLLPAIQLRHPEFQLSVYDQVRKTIVEDKRLCLTNESLMAMLGSFDQEKIDACYELAYKMDHPYIYKLAETSVPPEDYNLNFLWVNLNPQDRIKNVAMNIFKDGQNLAENSKPTYAADNEMDPDKMKTFTYRISKWADANPAVNINFWYDSALVTQEAKENTSKVMRDISLSSGVNLRLRDIRQLPSIKGEIKNSLHPGVPVYFRVDLLKVLIGDYMMSSSKENEKFSVVTDIDVEPMSSSQLFDQRTLNALSTSGYVFNRVGLSNFENSFFIFNKEKEGLQKAHFEIIERLESSITELRSYPLDTGFRSDSILGSQSVFNEYRSFREAMNEDWKNPPRKVVKCPGSQFNLGGGFSTSDHQSETFRFVEDSNVPYTKNGRNHSKRWESPIELLENWKSEPLV